ncbi:MAG TPA: efflux RND transporter periplasmic adaptor subunit [Deltaproteobacteria bacterium]|nr:efflux RND transporter periplasmic adaptor subunit [Deltaproteobacteria bacterium]
MKNRIKKRGDIFLYYPELILVVILSIILSFFGVSYAQDHSGHSSLKTSARQEKPEKETTWTCSMHPQIQMPKPGKCPICGMDLIPVAGKEKETKEMPGSLRELTLSPYARKLAEIQTSPVMRKFVSVNVGMVGKIEYDETRVGYITAWVPGRIDKLFVDFTGVTVEKGKPMVYLYSPELLAAQSELLEAIRASRTLKNSKITTIKTTARKSITAAKEKLKLLGLTDEQIREIIRKGKPSDHVTILAPMSGVVIHKNALEGMYVKTGTRIYTISDLTSVWAKLDAYESDLAWIREGQEVEFRVEAYPGEFFKGTITFIDPFINPKTRTVKVRVDVPNNDLKLKPEMFVHAVAKAPVSAAARVIEKPDKKTLPPLVIPASAPLITGKRAIVYVAVPGKEGTYEGREIVLGPRAGDYYLVLSGLKEGEKVVTNGNFKIDSSLQIQAKPSMMSPEGGSGGGGHQMKHGGMSMKSKDEKKKIKMKMDVPPAFVSQAKQLIRKYDELSKTIKNGNIHQIRSKFKEFETQLNSVNKNLLTGHLHMVWMELAMLMRNDAVLGNIATDRDEAMEAFEALTKHINRMKKQYKISLEKGHDNAG